MAVHIRIEPHSFGGALRDILKNGCEDDLSSPALRLSLLSPGDLANGGK